MLFLMSVVIKKKSSVSCLQSGLGIVLNGPDARIDVRATYGGCDARVPCGFERESAAFLRAYTIRAADV